MMRGGLFLTRQARRRAAMLLSTLAFLAACLTAAPVQAAEMRGPGDWGWLSGVLLYDTRLISRKGGNDGVAFNVEVQTPRIVRGRSWAPRLAVGATYAVDGISQAYAGPVWDLPVTRRLSLSPGLGVSVHDAEHLTFADAQGTGYDRKLLGCRVLARASLGLGYRVSERVIVQLHYDHVSNGGTCTNNQGLDNTGVRVGFRF
ncbi:MAG: acyloxyacyl hydrolase [Alphaproteobacteria bacterium]|nr:acyloxyacyl hydrolase [Alphaproteobacteria bacterium]